ncbi:hypothetical protein [Brachyspira aalborgi]|uniref:hypothetical protein n=1 Tax=Brachyspira aalborgi TaxID=29522 RepID=UPI0018F79F62|nr:hypothetical protein [Brachyspira aalborgi]
MNKKIPVEIKGRRAGDPAVLYADIGKVKNVLGWGVRPQSEAKKILEESIKSTYLWHINSINKK